MSLRKVLDIVLDGQDYQVAKNGGPYCLTREEGVDPYGVCYHQGVDPCTLSAQAIADLVDLLGSTAEDYLKLKAAVGRGGGE